MPYRLLLVDVSSDESAAKVLEAYALHVWPQENGGTMLHAVVRGSQVDAVLNALSTFPDPKIAILPVEAMMRPRTPMNAGRAPTAAEVFFTRDRLSTEEIRDDIEDGTRLTQSFLGMAVASAIIAALGMRSGQTAVVIGAMVIAPLLGPCMALAMAATVGDRSLGRRSGQALVAGSVAAFVATLALGTLVDVDAAVPELASRTTVRPADIGLALASGVAGVLAFCRGLSASLVGVMIAVALVPPLAAAGLLSGAALGGQSDGALALGAVFLFATNLVCINVAGIATFLLQGLPPREWRITRRVLALWIVLLAGLGLLIWTSAR